MKQVMLCLTLLLFPLPASAGVLYDWSGTCLTGCVGTATVHAKTAAAYVPGTLILALPPFPPEVLALLETFLYRDSTVTVDLAERWRSDGERFQLPAAAGALAEGLTAMSAEFHTRPDGTWILAAEGVRPGCTDGGICGYTATGTGGAWTYVGSETYAPRVPWPATALLLLVGFVPTAVFVFTTR